MTKEQHQHYTVVINSLIVNAITNDILESYIF